MSEQNIQTPRKALNKAYLKVKPCRAEVEVFKRFYAGGDLRGNTFRYKKAFLEPLPVPQLDDEASRPFEILVDCVQHARAQDMQHEAEQIEAVIDGLVYDLYFEQELRKANCFITERIQSVLQPFDSRGQTICEAILKLCWKSGVFGSSSVCGSNWDACNLAQTISRGNGSLKNGKQSP